MVVEDDDYVCDLIFAGVLESVGVASKSILVLELCYSRYTHSQ